MAPAGVANGNACATVPAEQAPLTYTVLVVDCQAEVREATRQLLEREGHSVLLASTGEEACSLLAGETVHVMLVDHSLPDMTGAEVIEKCRTIDDLVQTVLLTSEPGAYPPRELLRRLAIQGHHNKSDGLEKLLQYVDTACRTHSLLESSRQAERLKQQLLANVSHELRTPLNAILGFLDLIREGTCGPLAPEGTEAVTTIHRHALVLLHLINDFLDMSKLQAGAMQLTCEPVCVSMIVDEFRDALPILLGEVPVNVRWEVPPDAQAVADSGKVRVIVQNLISNAAKFTNEGEIGVEVRTNGTQTYVTVSDTGPGIQPDDQARIFDLFEQADVPGSRRLGGTGIGLYLARTLSRLMGGDLTLESTPGSGSSFTLRLPAAR